MAEAYMTMAEIEAKYPNEWVFIANPTHRWKGGGPPTGGYVVFHSAAREEFWRLIDTWDDPDVKHTASWYMGKEPPEEMLPPEAESESGAA